MLQFDQLVSPTGSLDGFRISGLVSICLSLENPNLEIKQKTMMKVELDGIRVVCNYGYRHNELITIVT